LVDDVEISISRTKRNWVKTWIRNYRVSGNVTNYWMEFQCSSLSRKVSKILDESVLN
jgi:hypothetical protein